MSQPRVSTEDPGGGGSVSAGDTLARGVAMPPTYALVDDLLTVDPLVLDPGAGVREAAARMTSAQSSYAAVPVDGAFAVLSDAGIRAWVAAGRPAEKGVAAIADRGQPCVRLGTSAAEALIMMLDQNADHVVVLDPAGALRGIVAARDFLVSPTMSGVSLHQQLQRASSLAELRRRAARLPTTLRDYTRRGLASSQVIAVHSTLVDIIVRRTIDLVLVEHDVDPAGFTWLSLGSNGRREAVLSSDIDAAVAFDDRVTAAEIERYRTVLGEVVGELARAGLTSDSHGATPAHQMFARTNAQWQQAGQQWLANAAENKGAVLISLLVDARPIYGDLERSSVAGIFSELRTHPAAMRLLLQYSLAQRARLRSVRDMLTRRGDRFNVKEHALGPIVNLARWAAMSAGSSALSTIDRLRATAGSAILPQEEASTLVEIFEVLQRLRLRYQLAQLDAGEQPTDVVSIDRLSPIDRSVIGQAVREIAAVQRRAANLLVAAPAESWLDPKD